MSFSLKLFGGIALTGEQGPVTGPAVQRHRLALLALLAAGHPGAVSRDKVMAWLWPERDAERARGLLNQTVYALRQVLGADALRTTGDDLALNPAVVECDVIAFEDALTEGAAERAVALYKGPFLDGFFLSEAPEFARWVERERNRLAGSFAGALEGLAGSAGRAGDTGKAAGWWHALAAHDPYDSRIALRLAEVLEQSGNRGGALQHALTHARLLREELGIEPPPELMAAVERLRQAPPVAADSRTAEANPPASRLAESEAEYTLGAPDSDIAPSSTRPRWALWYAAALVLLVGGIAGGARLWSGRGNANSMATREVVDEIALAVARELARRERGDTGHPAPPHRTRSIPAYELYLRGSDPALLRSDGTARLGLEYFRQALALDSTYAAAWAGLARMTLRVAGSGPAAQDEARKKAEAAARRALALEDSLAEAHAILGILRAQVYDFRSAEEHLQRAIALEPTRARHHEWASSLYLLTASPDLALAEAERALALEPLSPSATAEVARALLANDRCDEALARLEALVRLNPPLLRAAPIAAICHVRAGRYEEAEALLRSPSGNEDARTLPLLGYVLGRAGRRAEALAIQDRLTNRWRQGATAAFDLAFVPAALGDRDQAFTWLDRAYEDHSLGPVPGLGAGVQGPPFRDLRDDPRLTRLFTRLGIQNR